MGSILASIFTPEGQPMGENDIYFNMLLLSEVSVKYLPSAIAANAMTRRSNKVIRATIFLFKKQKPRRVSTYGKIFRN